MNNFPLEVQYVIFEQMIGSSLNFNSPKNITCPLGSLLTYCLVCRHWKQMLSPIMRHISKNPIAWCLEYEKRETFGKWLKLAENWAKEPNKQNKNIKNIKNIKNFVNKYNENSMLKPMCPCVNQAEKFSFAVFSALGDYKVSEDFLKFVWISIYQSKYFRTSLGDYYRKLVYRGDNATIERLAWIPISDKNIRNQLLKNNAAANVCYHLDRCMLTQERRCSVLWEPLFLSRRYNKINDLESRGITVPWLYIRSAV